MAYVDPHKLKVANLRTLLKSIGATTTGRKANLINRYVTLASKKKSPSPVKKSKSPSPVKKSKSPSPVKKSPPKQKRPTKRPVVVRKSPPPMAAATGPKRPAKKPARRVGVRVVPEWQRLARVQAMLRPPPMRRRKLDARSFWKKYSRPRRPKSPSYALSRSLSPVYEIPMIRRNELFRRDYKEPYYSAVSPNLRMYDMTPDRKLNKSMFNRYAKMLKLGPGYQF